MDRRQREKPGVRGKAMDSVRRGYLFKVLGYFGRGGGCRVYGVCWAHGATSQLFDCRPEPRIFSETSESAFLPSLHLPSQFQRLSLASYLQPDQWKWELEFRERRETASGLNLAGLPALVQALAWVDSQILPHFEPLFHTRAQNASLPC